MSSSEETEGFDEEALSRAASSGNLPLLQALVEQLKAELHPSFLTPKYLQRAMAAAVTSYNVPIVSYLMDEGAVVSPNNIVVALGDTEDAIE